MCAGLRKRTLGLLLLLLLLLLPLSGVCSDYGVRYPQASVCAVKNSSVFMACSFYYPSGLKVVGVMWGHERNDLFEGPFFFDSNNASSDSRFQYHGDKVGNCSLTIHRVRHNDSGEYAFRFLTDLPVGKYTGVNGPRLRVAELSVSPPSVGETKEGDSVGLTCRSGCSGAQESFAWFKDGLPLTVGTLLNLSAVSPSDSGNYTCSLSAHPGTTSEVKRVDVEYGPKSTSAGPPTEVDGGRSVSLVCSSRANPPVGSFVWFRMEDGVQVVGNQSVLVTAEDGEYFCSATNKHGSQNSSAVTVKIKVNWPYAASISITVAMLLIAIAVVIVVVAVRFRKKKKRAPETEYRQDVENQTHIKCDTSRLAKTNQKVKTAGTSEVIYTSVHFTSSRGKRKELVHDEVIYSTVHA